MRRHKNDTRPSAVATAGEGPTELVAAYKKMFDKYDVDHSGRLDCRELRNVCRNELRLPNKVLSEEEITEMWTHIDTENDGDIELDEFAAFVLKRKHDDPDDAKVCRLINEKMRKIEVVDTVTVRLNQHLVETAEREGGSHMSWFKMFNKYDADGTGRIDFDEFADVLRKELGISKKVLSDEEYRWLWDFLDAGQDGFIEVQEFAEFMRGKQKEQQREVRRGRRMGTLLAEVCHKMNAAMQRLAAGEAAAAGGDGAGPPVVTRAHWFRLFQEADDDETGQIDRKEFTRLVRSDLRMGVDELSQEELLLVWDEVDDSDDELVEVREFIRVLFASDVFAPAPAAPATLARTLGRSVSRQELRDARAGMEAGEFVGLRMATLLNRKDPSLLR